MVIKVYVAMISCSQEIKKNQQRAIMILESKNIPYTVIDITDPGNEEAKDYMMSSAVPKPESKVPVTPQIFNEADYCGDYDGLDMANECDTLGDFLKLSDEEKSAIKIGITGLTPEEKAKAQAEQSDINKMTNGVSASREGSTEKTEEAATIEQDIGDAANEDITEAPAEEVTPETQENIEEAITEESETLETKEDSPEA